MKGVKKLAKKQRRILAVSGGTILFLFVAFLTVGILSRQTLQVLNSNTSKAQAVTNAEQQQGGDTTNALETSPSSTKKPENTIKESEIGGTTSYNACGAGGIDEGALTLQDTENGVLPPLKKDTKIVVYCRVDKQKADEVIDVLRKAGYTQVRRRG